MPDSQIFEERDREEFLRFARDELGERLFERVSGELWLRCRPQAKRCAAKPPELRELTMRNELRLLVRRIIRGENSFWNREQPRLTLPKIVPLWNDNDDE